MLGYATLTPTYLARTLNREALRQHWPEIRRVVERGQASSLYCSIATVGEDGTPTVTPIGTVFLGANPGGFFFDRYTSDLGNNINANGKICLLAVNSSKLFWLRSFLLGRFTSPPGVRLYGTAGPLRAATASELSQIERRVRSSKWLKGNQLIWSSFTQVRDLEFTSFRPVSYPAMMERLWQ
ncbi:MAG: Pyridoxamine 5-phosphate oxidase [Hydrocarboniphaga sp.]|nr:Pyridoxamine 5-phosphate oxidase [Hydrocarboniphaga sp.]